MEQTNDAPDRHADTSKLLIAGILLAAVVFLFCTPATEDERISQVLALFPLTTLLLGLYTFSYRGRKFLISRMLFFVFLLVSVLAIAGWLYVMELGKAFQH
jgi:uncharacterized membrane-anchored protein